MGTGSGFEGHHAHQFVQTHYRAKRCGSGGGSLVYANTCLSLPKLFEAESWRHLAAWEEELKPYYDVARRMLGATQHPYHSKSEKAILSLAEELGKIEAFEKPHLAIYFGKPGRP